MQPYQRTNIAAARVLQAAFALLQRKQQLAGIRARLLGHAANEQLLLGGSQTRSVAH